MVVMMMMMMVIIIQEVASFLGKPVKDAEKSLSLLQGRPEIACREGERFHGCVRDDGRGVATREEHPRTLRRSSSRVAAIRASEASCT